MNYFCFSQQIVGSSLLSPAHGKGGAGATALMLTAFAKQKKKFGGGDPSSRTQSVRYGAGSEGGAGKQTNRAQKIR